MLRSFLRAWRARALRAETARLAFQLGPHLARDIGIDGAETPRDLPVPRAY